MRIPSRLRRPGAALAALFATALLAPAALAAHPGKPVAVQAVFTEGGRFTVRNVDLAGAGPVLVVQDGGRVQGSLEFKHHCKDCGASINQILVGLAGEGVAQDCVYSGGAFTKGWTRVPFELDVPDRPGRYEVRVRYAQAWGCKDAPAWWTVDRPQGPGPGSTVAVIEVVKPVPAPVPIQGARPARAVMEDIDQVMATLQDRTAKLVAVAQQPPTSGNRKKLRNLSQQVDRLTADLALLHDELSVSLNRPRPHRPVMMPAPQQPQPQVIVVTTPPPAEPPPPVAMGPYPMEPRDFRELKQRLEDEPFENNRLNLLRDAIQAGAAFTADQALAILGGFTFESNKVDVAVELCQVVVEPGVLPRMIGSFTFESNRDALRKRTGGRCGPPQ